MIGQNSLPRFRQRKEKVMQISFLAWPPQRLIREAVLVHNLRHPEDKLDRDQTPWERIVPCLFAFIRHELTDYDTELYHRTQGQRSREERDRLVREISAQAKRTWGWLASDPRGTFGPAGGKELEYDRAARQLADERTILHHVARVLRDTRAPKRRAELKSLLSVIERDIANDSIPFQVKNEVGEDGKRFAHGHSRLTATGKDYDFFGLGLAPSYVTHLAGVHCPRCSKIIRCTKSPVKLGQGRRRYIYSCHCLCLAIAARNLLLSPERWTQSLSDHGLI